MDNPPAEPKPRCPECGYAIETGRHKPSCVTGRMAQRVAALEDEEPSPGNLPERQVRALERQADALEAIVDHLRFLRG